jgi:hypothetical protein
MADVTPHNKLVKRRETVVDARICEMNACPFFTKRQRGDGDWVAGCDAGIYHAELPVVPLQQHIATNSATTPGANADDNPFLLRLLMSPQCVRPECGLAQIEYKERLLIPHPDELLGSLFPSGAE